MHRLYVFLGYSVDAGSTSLNISKFEIAVSFDLDPSFRTAKRFLEELLLRKVDDIRSMLL